MRSFEFIHGCKTACRFPRTHLGRPSATSGHCSGKTIVSQEKLWEATLLVARRGLFSVFVSEFKWRMLLESFCSVDPEGKRSERQTSASIRLWGFRAAASITYNLSLTLRRLRGVSPQTWRSNERLETTEASSLVMLNFPFKGTIRVQEPEPVPFTLVLQQIIFRVKHLCSSAKHTPYFCEFSIVCTQNVVFMYWIKKNPTVLM